MRSVPMGREAPDKQEAQKIVAELKKYAILLREYCPTSQANREVAAILRLHEAGELRNPAATLFASALRLHQLAGELPIQVLSEAAYVLLALSLGLPCPETCWQYADPEEARELGLTFHRDSGRKP